MKIVHVSAECYPIAKVGGLADVVGSLPKYQNETGAESLVIMPHFDTKFTAENSFDKVYSDTLTLGDKEYSFNVLSLKNINLGFELFSIDVPELIFKDYVYSYDDTERFLAFQIAALNWMLTWDDKPAIVHCHDHHTGLTPFMMSQCYQYEQFKNIPTILTIHNAQYQGWFSHDRVHLLPEFDMFKSGLLDWDGQINPLAAAIKCAWKVTTVSPSYMEELKSNANGLEALLTHESDKCVGILNGIDSDVWNPETDKYIIKNFKKSTVISGRKANKKWLCKEFNLDPKKPLFAFIGRLVGEKGAELLPQVFDKVLESENISVLLLGSGIPEVENELQVLKEKYQGSYNAFIGYDEKLSHIIYAGADFLLMPSRVEPCGLNQLYSLRYGLIPIVREIGGLKDTVIDISNNGFGFTHIDVDVNQIVDTIKRAVTFYNQKEAFNKNRKKIMEIDHSWNVSAQEYINLYNSIN